MKGEKKTHPNTVEEDGHVCPELFLHFSPGNHFLMNIYEVVDQSARHTLSTNHFK